MITKTTANLKLMYLLEVFCDLGKKTRGCFEILVFGIYQDSLVPWKVSGYILFGRIMSYYIYTITRRILFFGLESSGARLSIKA